MLLLYQPIQTWQMCFDQQFKHKVKLINKIVINQVISYWPSYVSSFCCIGAWPSASGQYSRPRTHNWDMVNKVKFKVKGEYAYKCHMFSVKPLFANNAHPIHTQQNAASDQGQHCLLTINYHNVLKYWDT